MKKKQLQTMDLFLNLDTNSRGHLKPLSNEQGTNEYPTTLYYGEGKTLSLSTSRYLMFQE